MARTWGALAALLLVATSCDDPWVMRTKHTNGATWSELHHSHGQPNGPSRVWHANQQLEREGSHLDGHRHGLWREWNRAGVLLSERTYERGRLEGRTRYWHQDGTLRLEGEYRFGLRTGTWTERFENGEVGSLSSYANGKRHGEWQAWDRSGTWLGGARYVDGTFVGKLEARTRPATTTHTPN